MAQKKKLQVFLSSTYVDLKEERQAAVEAVLIAGHIPAGMELFTSGDQSQWNVIKRWIDESDVYLLILGGRYGSVEPKSGKSYIHLEYEYAIETGKPLFAVVIEERVLKERVKIVGLDVYETEHLRELKSFRELVLTKMVRFWSDTKDIKLSIMETLADFSNRPNLVGWIPGSENINSGALAEEISRLSKENSALREEVQKHSVSHVMYNGLSFDDFYRVLAQEELEDWIITRYNPALDIIVNTFKDPAPGLLHLFWLLFNEYSGPVSLIEGEEEIKIFYSLELLGILQEERKKVNRAYSQIDSILFKLTDLGKQFLLRLRVERDTFKARNLISN